ncbi:exodeoxyribonuclease V subunit beta [Conservatibacter flavescens]|uniref:RecBCD enzyme subunit RecB n=1 Tax=Conservatibacter flavescens TaxID=28161 RepID=A0A2M8S5N4_9PAST|nr:exodeoxyribonuclease V subunit beta [Conservatibacter flavescens]PJG86465.1 exodeoxyribonuclease V subunit beta [Conservatibacter flavescens]
MTKTTALNPISLPLNSVCLVEASAGTGKTYTMVSLYLRLLLQVGENNFPEALNVEQILVVTFTEASTEELKKNIRERVTEAKQKFVHYQQHQDITLFDDSPFLAQLVNQITDLPLAIQRLTLAEQNMDMAAIYTIHGFCRRILMQYAVHSGVHFNLELNKDESDLKTKYANDYWRKHYYGLSLNASQFIHEHLVSPQHVLKKINAHLTGEPLKLSSNQPHLFNLTLDEFIAQYIEPLFGKTSQLKQQWKEHFTEVETIILTEIQRDYKKGIPKRLKRTSFKANLVPNWLKQIQTWANSEEMSLPEALTKYFSQKQLREYYTEEGAAPIEHPIFELVDEVIENQQYLPLYVQVLYWHYLNGVRQALLDYKLNHQQKNFDDLLMILYHALLSEQGKMLAELIQKQYPFAMIDEFQDTDNIQYQIFAKIYLENPPESCGFIMIGDPKQAIYKFRGADIFTYLNAAHQAKERFNLNKNWRSSAALVQTVNQLFAFPNAFLYSEIDFIPVEAQRELNFTINGHIQSPWVCYLADSHDKANFAQACATSIQHWLYYGEQQSALLNQTPITGKNIAVLVRNWREAELIKEALGQLGIASVYLSDDKNVFHTKEAKEMALILTACLNPFHERHILNAISTSLFALTSAEIQRIKFHENTWELWVERFLKYQRVWQYQGVLAMLHQLFLQENISAKLLSQSNGERRLTNILHLAELLQQTSPLNENEMALLRWFERQLREDESQDERQIRLESEQDLVKIVTFHKSKGLEYDLVWLPFVGQGMRNSESVISTYHSNEKKQILWDIEQQHSEQILHENMAEEMRLLYVALTRAKYQIAMTLPREFIHKGKGADKWSAFLYTLTQGEIGEKYLLSQDIQTQDYLQHFVAPQDIMSIDDLQPLAWIPKPVISDLQPRYFHGKIERHWQISSFTALSRQHERLKSTFIRQNVRHTDFYDEAQDHDMAQGESLISLSLHLEKESVWDYPEQHSPFDFPQGAQTGIALHNYFEHCQFEQKVSEEAVEQICDELKLNPEDWSFPVKQWLQRIVETPLNKKGLNLSQITQQNTLRELQFYLKLKQDFNLSVFNQLLQQYHLPREPFCFDSLQGMVRGFIDLVFRHNGQYYIVDYKSNYLGHAPQHYEQAALERYMLDEHYDLQYLLYTVALHRYLTQRDVNYDYERDFGGVFYLFLRGMNGLNDDYGVYTDKPDFALIKALDALF